MRDVDKPRMEHVRRLAQLWNWLPAFRVVAETRHLPSASEELGVTAPALSRTIKLLEEQLGQPLFSRAGRRLALNDAGQSFLLVVREAMRSLDQGLEVLAHATLQGPLRLSARGHHSWIFCRPALRSLRVDCPELIPHLYNLGNDEAIDRLRDGTLDLAVLEDAEQHPDLVVERLADITYGIHCADGHPLFEQGAATMSEILAHDFAAPVAGIDDHWPRELERQIGFYVTAFHDAVHMCASGQFLAMLPDAIAESDRAPTRLRRLAPELAPTAPVFAVYRRPRTDEPRVDAMLAALRRHIAETAGADTGVLREAR